ncbi:MAG: rod-binding protein [Acidibrevibacterium sp.]|jgi:Rod binding domain-containing protein|uniref:rod-binding protein n=1 Tax=Acidibrevibacterium fodinaquatile TaxID=1969806 RepID=UPI0023A843CA|nr:rod-binding protein [Acidibrevibacterium fodinaquatile]MCA7118631.1 rod-binding protein [Acidibrevibacterium fodinaquatile]
MAGALLPPVSAIPPEAAGLSPAVINKAWTAAHDFEAMALGRFLAPMFDTVDLSHSAFGGGSAEESWKPMLIDAIGKQISAAGGLGLARPVFAEMLRMQEAATHAALDAPPPASSRSSSSRMEKSP